MTGFQCRAWTYRRGIILSRDGTQWIREGAGIEDVALPLYEGRMIGQFDFSEKGWVSGKGRGAVWREIPWERKQIEPQYLMGEEDYWGRIPDVWRPKVVHMNVGSATNARTAIGSFLAGIPSGHSAPTLTVGSVGRALGVTAVFNSLVSDFVARSRVTGLHLDYHVLEQNPLLPLGDPVVRSTIAGITRALCLGAHYFAPMALELLAPDPRRAATNPLGVAVTVSERVRLRAILDATIAMMFGLDYSDLQRITEHCDLPTAEIASRSLNPKGFWRLDRDRNPELRHTVLTLVAFKDLESTIHETSGDRSGSSFFAQNEGEGWLLPEILRLADYDLGHDERARRHHPVATRMGPRFYDWQLVQKENESWREGHLHVRNLLGRLGYAQLIGRLIEHRELTNDQHHDLLFGRLTRDLVGGEAESPTPLADGIIVGDRKTLRAAERTPPYPTEPSATPPQAEMFRRPQTDLFE